MCPLTRENVLCLSDLTISSQVWVLTSPPHPPPCFFLLICYKLYENLSEDSLLSFWVALSKGKRPWKVSDNQIFVCCFVYSIHLYKSGWTSARGKYIYFFSFFHVDTITRWSKTELMAIISVTSIPYIRTINKHFFINIIFAKILIYYSNIQSQKRLR